MQKPNKFNVVVDTREQKPYSFPNPVKKALSAGDYSIEGLEDQVSVERKTKSDAYGTFGKGRARFMRELKKLSQMQYAAIVIEVSLQEFLKPPKYSLFKPQAAINSAISWSVKYGVHVFWVDNRELGHALTNRILEKYWKHNGQNSIARAEGISSKSS